MRIDASGKVGIGTTGPESALTVAGTGWDHDPSVQSVQMGVSSNVARMNLFGTSGSMIDFTDAAGEDADWRMTTDSSTWRIGATTAQYGLAINTSGNVGIGTTNPITAKLVVSGNVSGASIDAGSQRIINVAPPVGNADATTKQYVDQLLTSVPVASSSGAYLLKAGDSMLGNLNLSGYNISGVNKLFVTTIDPLYEINGSKYATYVPNSIGQISQVYGKINLSKNEYKNEDDHSHTYTYSAVIDFTNSEHGSNLWLFWQTISEGDRMQNITANLTPEFNGRVWYELRPAQKQIAIFGQKYENEHENKSSSYSSSFSNDMKSLTISYHLSAPRHDSYNWPNAVPHETEKGIILKAKN
ncbi:MAG: hypothetical protein FJY98_04800 [Candidatus Liptonbacteria bacterium]|nr:hypothetical protein [Candidatus Liptonbacteria bacterium]